jgi:hypothetical protein
VVILDGDWPPSEAKMMRAKPRPALFPREHGVVSRRQIRPEGTLIGVGNATSRDRLTARGS